MREGRGDGGLGPGGGGAVPPWPVPGSGEPGPARPAAAYRPGLAAGHRAYAGRGHSPRGGRLLRALLLLGVIAGAAGLIFSAVSIVVQIMPRTFTAAQREQIVAWEIGKRWRSWQAGQIFPQTIAYSLSGRAFGGGQSLSLTAQRVGIAPQASCRDAVERAAAGVLDQHGCAAVLRATYEDTTQTLAVTVGVAVLPAGAAARKTAAALGTAGSASSGIKAVSFRRTATSRFGDRSQKLWWDRVAGPYLVLAAVGYADGRPWLARGNDTYTQAELLGLASGTGQRVAAALGAQPAAPRCPGNPAC